MLRREFFVPVVCACILSQVVLVTDSLGNEARSRESFNEGWRFKRFAMAEEEQGASETAGIDSDPDDYDWDFDDSDWRLLNLPHDWGVEAPFQIELPGKTGKLPWFGIGWYRKELKLPAEDVGKRVFLDFDGAMSDAKVFVNRQQVGSWPYGYSSFRVELTDYLQAGQDNSIEVRLDNQANSSRWYPGGGLYRNVWLVKTGPVHVDHWGTFVRTPVVNEREAVVDLDVTVRNSSDGDAGIHLVTQILDENGSAVARNKSQGVTVKTGATQTTTQQIKLRRPTLWSLDNPALYQAVTDVVVDGKVVDRYETTFGLREIAFDAKKGFLLNGQPVKLNGVCLHHDLGPLGAAIHTRALERQIELLQEMGCNAIRTSHNPPAPELLDLCDRMGMLVQVEAFDCWGKGKTNNDYSRFFWDWHERDLTAMVQRDRNHPSVIMWSTGNEIREQGNKAGHKLSAKLSAIIRELDPTRPVTAGCNNANSGKNGFQKTVDVFGYNYKPHLYEGFHQRNPDIPLYGSETSSCISSRGVYVFPVTEDKSGGQVPYQMSSYDLYAPRWATKPDTEFAAQDRYPFVMGEFVWTGFDYLGEPTPYNGDSTNLLNFQDPKLIEQMKKELEKLGRIKDMPSRSSYFGILDLCGFKKDRFYLYQAKWRPELPMAHTLPHWTWPERVGEVTPVHVYTSGDEAELFLNDRSLGRKKKEPFQYRLRWDDVVYEPGELKVVAYKNGKRWAEDVQQTTGPPASIEIKGDRTTILADGSDLAYLTVRILDEQGQLVPRADNLIEFSAKGPADLVAVGNGNAASLQPFQADRVTAFNGMCLGILRSHRGVTGTVQVVVRAEGIKGAQANIVVGNE